MAEPYTCTIRKADGWVVVLLDGGTVGPNSGSGTLYWATSATEPVATHIGIEFERTPGSNLRREPFGTLATGIKVLLRTDGEWLVSVEPDARPNPLPGL